MINRIVVMGVAASGKTTYGQRLARELEAIFLDADDAHPQANIAKMSAGEALDDADRWPWLDHLADALAGSENIVVTCSALKRTYRDRLRTAADGVRFIYLRIGPDLAHDRIRARSGHFMGESTLKSQFATLEEPSTDEADVTIIDQLGRSDDG